MAQYTLTAQLREQKGLLLREVAAHLEIDTAMISKIERGEKSCKREHIERLADILDGSESELISIWLADKILEIVVVLHHGTLQRFPMIVVQAVTQVIGFPIQDIVAPLVAENGIHIPLHQSPGGPEAELPPDGFSPACAQHPIQIPGVEILQGKIEGHLIDSLIRWDLGQGKTAVGCG